MEAEDFPTSPAKRQRTGSPEPPSSNDALLEPLSVFAPKSPTDGTPTAPEPTAPEPMDTHSNEVVGDHQKSPTPEEQSSNSLVDALMLQVEAESNLEQPTLDLTATAEETAPPRNEKSDAAQEKEKSEVLARMTATKEQHEVAALVEHDAMELTEQHIIDHDAETKHVNEIAPDANDSMQTVPNTADAPALFEPITMDAKPTDTPASVASGTMDAIPTGAPAFVESGKMDAIPTGAPAFVESGTMDATPTDAPAFIASGTMDAIPTDATLVPEAAMDGAEWEIDSSPYESSTDSDSSESSSEEDSDEDADGDYAMLDPEEAARILMQGEGGSDDEGDGSRKKEGGLLRTANERMEEVIPKPDIVVTEDMKMEELGNVEFVVESTVVIRAKTSGEYQVLEPGSLICLKDRSVVGVVADLIGRVEEPRYTIRFTNEDSIKEAGLWEVGTTVFYVPQHSTFVFTQPLKAVKGSDASNFHDEEVGDEEMEFSDDEAEAEHKRQLKAKRQGRTVDGAARGGRGGSKFGRGPHRGGGRGSHRTSVSSINVEGSAYGNGSLEMNYDDVSVPDTNDDGYTPLQRPSNLADMMTRGEQPQERALAHPPPSPPSHLKGGEFGGRGRGRGYGQNRGGRGGFRHPRGGRGGFNQQPRLNQYAQQNASSYQHNGLVQQNGYSSSHQTNSMAPPIPNISVPTTPSITPQNISYPPMTPSPITPLPNVPYSFGRGFQPPTNFPPFAAPLGIPGLPPPPGFLQNYNYQQQQPQPNHYQNHQQYGAQQGAGEGQANYLSGAWANNPAVAAALQRQIEEQRRAQGQ